MRKRKFSGMKLEEAMPLIGASDFTKWSLNVPARPPSDHLSETLRRLDAFDTLNTEAAKLLLVDTLRAETVPNYPTLKVWKGEALESATLTGFADYVITLRFAYVQAAREEVLTPEEQANYEAGCVGMDAGETFLAGLAELLALRH